MKAVVLINPNRIELCETDIPKPSYGEILVKVKAALTCGTDLKAFTRGHPVIPMPGVFGHEFSGIVADTGKGVKKFKKGDAIMAVHSAPCLKCDYCKKRLYNLCKNIMQTKVLGAFAEYILLPRHIVKQNVFHKPKHLRFEEAAFLEPLSCVVHGMRSLKIKKGDKALVIGAGPIGLLHLLLLKNRGVDVIITGLEKKRLAFAKKLGAISAIMPDKLKSILKSLTNGSGVDYVFECTGQPDIWQSSVDYVRRGGTVILFGGCKSGTTVIYDTARLHYDEITLKGVFHFTPDDVKEAYKLLKTGKIRVSKLISGRYSLKDIEKAFLKLKKGEGIKYAITP
ncbi:MAG: alcohol dehydrogenase catalytic domain-containing protein [Nitrospirae bacterium]|nr:alcohol dehydrogenase catalytic domain-containing protein [Nitrospirota bacterium]